MNSFVILFAIVAFIVVLILIEKAEQDAKKFYSELDSLENEFQIIKKSGDESQITNKSYELIDFVNERISHLYDIAINSNNELMQKEIDDLSRRRAKYEVILFTFKIDKHLARYIENINRKQ